MEILIVIALIFLWVVFGSFGSVIFFRLGDIPTRKVLKGFLIGRSECTHCHHPLAAKDLIPLYSFLSQKGKCRYCKAKLSWRYPFLEISTVLIFLLCYFFLGASNPLLLFFACGISWLLRLILLYDIYRYELHLSASIAVAVLTFLALLVLKIPFIPSLQSALLFFLLFLAIYLFARLYVFLRFKEKGEGFWFWDVIFAPMIGLLLSFFWLPTGGIERTYTILLYLIFSCTTGILYYFLALLFVKQQRRTSSKPVLYPTKTLPFLPAMLAGLVLLIYLWPQLLRLLLFF